MTIARQFAACALALATLAGCHQRAAENAGTQAGASAAPDAKPGAALSDARLVLPAVNGNPAAAYFTVANAGKKVISIAAVAVQGAGKADMHQTMGGTMSPVDQADVQPNSSLKFEPGGFHVMVFDLDPKLAAGGTTELTVTFADGDKASAPMKIEAPGGGASDDMAGMDMSHH